MNTIWDNAKTIGSYQITLIDGIRKFNTDPSAFVNDLVLIGVGIGGVVAVILVAMGGYSILMSQGNIQKIKDGREQITNALLGYALVLLTVTIVNFIVNQFGININ